MQRAPPCKCWPNTPTWPRNINEQRSSGSRAWGCSLSPACRVCKVRPPFYKSESPVFLFQAKKLFSLPQLCQVDITILHLIENYEGSKSKMVASYLASPHHFFSKKICPKTWHFLSQNRVSAFERLLSIK